VTSRAGLDRRGLLRAGGAAAALVVLSIGPGCQGDFGDRRDRPTALARACFDGDADGAAVVGAAYAAARGRSIEVELADLRAHIETVDDQLAGDDDAVVAALADEIAAELRAGRTIRLDGWTCAPTELRLAALVSLGA
jgi:hypothetical protein